MKKLNLTKTMVETFSTLNQALIYLNRRSENFEYYITSVDKFIVWISNTKGELGSPLSYGEIDTLSDNIKTLADYIYINC